MDRRTGAVRLAEFAGTWYPGDAEELGQAVDRYLQAAGTPQVKGDLVGLIAPHAGLAYSGAIAAHAYNELRGRRFDVVAVVSPVHRTYATTLLTTAADAYATPLGEVPVATDVLQTIAKTIPLQRIQHDGEHSLEIQLPYLRRILGAFPLVPLMMPDQSLAACRALGSALATALKGRSVLLVASTDLSHFHRLADAERLDRATLDAIAAYDPIGLSRALESGATEACGGGPVIAVMLAAQALGANRGMVLKYGTSADTTGDKRSVVGYGAAALYREA